MIRTIHQFPRGFLWGTATSSHQVEGNNTNNDWWEWEHGPGLILDGHKSGTACDWWGGRWQEDFDRAAAGSQNTHRFSIEWSRIEPSPATWDEEALLNYREMIRGALNRGLMPFVTLHHFTNPRWVAERGGWENQEIVSLFERYTRKVISALHDLVGIWVTINEPNVYAVAAYLAGVFPPGKRDIRLLPVVIRNMILAHVAAYHTIHEIQPAGQVGLAHHYRGFRPANPRSPLDRWLANFKREAFNELIPSTLNNGRFRFLIWRDRLPQAMRTQDFIGLNYYTTEQSLFHFGFLSQAWDTFHYSEDSDVSPTGFIVNEPEGMWEALQWAQRFQLPIYITENGVEDHEGNFRPRYLAAHLRQIWRGVNFNWPIRGYFHWTLVDNFEWERGWTQRFGLWELDQATQTRRKRPSADFYADICQANGLSSEMVAMYAPEIFDELFPPRGPVEFAREPGGSVAVEE